MNSHTKRLTPGVVSGLAAVAIAFAGDEIIRPRDFASPDVVATPALPPTSALVQQGYALFMLNCAHCHGKDARGDEGPDLHGVTKSDEHIARIIKNGIKGEMPKFGAKLGDGDVQALVAFVRSLRETPQG